MFHNPAFSNDFTSRCVIMSPQNLESSVILLHSGKNEMTYVYFGKILFRAHAAGGLYCIGKGVKPDCVD
jgi:hypothetical protein